MHGLTVPSTYKNLPRRASVVSHWAKNAASRCRVLRAWCENSPLMGCFQILNLCRCCLLCFKMLEFVFTPTCKSNTCVLVCLKTCCCDAKTWRRFHTKTSRRVSIFKEMQYAGRLLIASMRFQLTQMMIWFLCVMTQKTQRVCLHVRGVSFHQCDAWINQTSNPVSRHNPASQSKPLCWRPEKQTQIRRVLRVASVQMAFLPCSRAGSRLYAGMQAVFCLWRPPKVKKRFNIYDTCSRAFLLWF